MTEIPDENTLVKVYGARCTDCGLELPVAVKSLPGGLALERRVEADWRRRGLGEWIQKGWPQSFPAWMVRKGFRCAACQAPNLLIALSPEALA